jgi:hypothetical protein
MKRQVVDDKVKLLQVTASANDISQTIDQSLDVTIQETEDLIDDVFNGHDYKN